jgi:hypothetical protein
MPRIVVTCSREIPSPAPLVYRILADYRSSHPLILPPQHFFDYNVEQGGYGAGTVIRFRMRLAGMTRHARAKVSEPQPGRLLLETYPDTGIETSFEVVQGENGSVVTIRTDWNSTGLKGCFERLVAPRLLRRVYVEELQRLADFAADRERFRNSRQG